MAHSSAQTHDRINLLRFVSKLDATLSQPVWSATVAASGHGRVSTLEAQAAFQKVKHARKMLKGVREWEEEHSTQSSGQTYLDDVQATLDRLLSVVQSAQQRLPDKSPRPAPLLATIPIPAPSIQEQPDPSPGPVTALLDVDTPSLPTTELLGLDEGPSTNFSELNSYTSTATSPTDPPPAYSGSSTSDLVPSRKPSASSQNEGRSAPSFLQNSQAVQEELSAQLAAMASQLRRNAQHFASQLNADKSLVVSASEKLEANFDVMTKERVRLRDRGTSARGQTCFVLAAVVGVVFAFAFMVLLIRVT